MTDLLGAVKRALFFYGADDEWPAMGDGSIIAQGDIACWLRALVAEVERLRSDLDAAHFVRSKIEHAKCNAELTDMREDRNAWVQLEVKHRFRADRAEADLAALRQRHAEAVKEAFREGWGRGYVTEREEPLFDLAWNTSQAKARLT